MMRLNRTPAKIEKIARRTHKWLHWRFTNHKNESVFFYTFHKCASSLFSGFVLHNIPGLYNRDYAYMIYTNNIPHEIAFDKTGYIYGPIRLSAKTNTPVYENLIQHVSTPEFVHDKLSIFLVRDPRDILVSRYYSFGFTHGLSANPQIQGHQYLQREKIQAMNLDEYVVAEAPTVQQHFNLAYELAKSCKRGVILRYEDMIDNFEHFTYKLNRVLKVSNRVKEQMFLRTRPKTVEDISAHRRNGRPGNFRNKLEKKTITTLNTILNPTLKLFGYSEPSKNIS